MLSDYLADRIRDAASWYGDAVRRDKTSAGVRSLELRPKYSFFEVSTMCQSVESVAKYQAALVGDVCLGRNVILRERNAERSGLKSEPMGRILVLDTFLCTYDGLAADSTDKFFDDSDCPPWDLWIDYEIDVAESSLRNVRGLLSAWIPEEFFGIVEEAILVSGGEALSWGSEEHVGLDGKSISAYVEELGRSVVAA
jgi:hypothetical protein